MGREDFGRKDLISFDEAYLNLLRFHSNEAKVILQRYEQIQLLIGKEHHHPSEGHYCEDLVREFLRSILPRKYSVDTGFIRSYYGAIYQYGGGASQQLDVIVHDHLNYAPIFRCGEFVVVLPAAAVAVIEVKKTLTSGDLKDALALLAGVRRLQAQSMKGRQFAPLFTGIFAFDSAEELKPKTKAFSQSYGNRLEEACNESGPALALPDAIVVANEHIMCNLDPMDASRTRKPNIRRCAALIGEDNIAGQLFTKLLIDHLDLPEASDRESRFSLPSVLQWDDVYSHGPH